MLTPTSSNKTRIAIYTDGSCLGNPGVGGCAAIIRRLDTSGDTLELLEVCGSEFRQTTNVRMEMTAACAGIESLGRITSEPITLLSDANLISKGMNEWLTGWKAKGWKTSSGKPVLNQDLWERLEKAAEGRNIAFKWVKGHNGHPDNERADRLAKEAAARASQDAIMIA